VTVTGRKNAWAVGHATSGTSGRSLILRWNGSKWRQVPNKAGKSELLAVAATSARSAWAVGDDSTGRSLVLRWNGRRWARVASPNIEKKGNDNLLSGVAATSSRNAWAVGTGTIAFGDGARGFVLHWNGRKWTRMTSPSPIASVTHLDAVAATSAGNAWAVGTFAPDTAKDQTKTYALRCR
jgi:hypothetical protein